MDTKRLKSKEEQEFWDKAFFLVLGKGNRRTGFLYDPVEAAVEADKFVELRRSRYELTLPRCEVSFGAGLENTYICCREKDHEGKHKAY